MGATKVFLQINRMLVSVRAEILRDGLRPYKNKYQHHKIINDGR